MQTGRAHPNQNCTLYPREDLSTSVIRRRICDNTIHDWPAGLSASMRYDGKNHIAEDPKQFGGSRMFCRELLAHVGRIQRPDRVQIACFRTIGLMVYIQTGTHSSFLREVCPTSRETRTETKGTNKYRNQQEDRRQTKGKGRHCNQQVKKQTGTQLKEANTIRNTKQDKRRRQTQ